MIRKPLPPTPSEIIYVNRLLRPEVRLLIFLFLIAFTYVGANSFRVAQNVSANYQLTLSANITAAYFQGQTFTAAPTLTATYTSTPIPVNTYTPLPPPTYTSTPVPTICSEIDATEFVYAADGYALKVHCRNGVKFEIGPLANGVHAVGPNNKFLVYCSNEGDLYTLRAEQHKLVHYGHLRKELPFFRDNYETLQELSFIGENPYYLVVSNRYTGQSTTVQIPTSVSQ